MSNQGLNRNHISEHYEQRNLHVHNKVLKKDFHFVVIVCYSNTYSNFIHIKQHFLVSLEMSHNSKVRRNGHVLITTTIVTSNN